MSVKVLQHALFLLLLAADRQGAITSSNAWDLAWQNGEQLVAYIDASALEPGPKSLAFFGTFVRSQEGFELLAHVAGEPVGVGRRDKVGHQPKDQQTEGKGTHAPHVDGEVEVDGKDEDVDKMGGGGKSGGAAVDGSD